jgi:magnesium-transporting ATPase (P-type)
LHNHTGAKAFNTDRTQLKSHGINLLPFPSSFVRYLLAGSALCSKAHLVHPLDSSQWQEIGDPTEAALLVAAIKSGLNLEELHQRSPRLRELPFDSRRRMMTVVVDCLT